MQIEWSDKFRAGVERLDNQHKELIELINKLQLQITKGSTTEHLKAVIAEIYELKKNHFADEERLMLDHNYPHFEQHAKEHQEMLDRLTSFAEGLAAGDKMVMVDLIGYLVDWLSNHISQADTQYGIFFNDRGVY